ncbi:hypothetical protein JRQ81_018961 [Phrynocephalus forsythii]|uniref:Uncharacterized protein n=1 Tax=Phrynocephalus forsythii TaxID=171643 RepID=A0A9Q0XQI1_9SAUR|nr:hypothetical protein JRQ81_018961 [Phrynocephalus forsythii]
MRRKKSKPLQEAKWVRSAPSDHSLERLERLRRIEASSALQEEEGGKRNQAVLWKKIEKQLSVLTEGLEALGGGYPRKSNRSVRTVNVLKRNFKLLILKLRRYKQILRTLIRE